MSRRVLRCVAQKHSKNKVFYIILLYYYDDEWDMENFKSTTTALCKQKHQHQSTPPFYIIYIYNNIITFIIRTEYIPTPTYRDGYIHIC